MDAVFGPVAAITVCLVCIVRHNGRMIRPFNNADVPHLARVWQSNAARLEFEPPPVALSMIERALVARVGFDRDDLWVLADGDAHGNLDNDQPLSAFIHRCHVSGESYGLVAADSSVRADELTRLIQHADVDWLGGRFTETPGGEGQPSVMPYTGLSPLGFGVGLLTGDRLVRTAAADAGYAPVQDLVEWSIDPARFRMPVNRAMMTLRRSLRLQFVDHHPGVSAADAIGHPCCSSQHTGHLQQQVCQSVTDHQPISSLVLSTSDPEYAVMDPAVALFHCPTEHQDQLGAEESVMGDIDSYVLGQWIIETAKMGVRRISTTLQSDAPQSSSLATLGFQPGETGSTFSR